MNETQPPPGAPAPPMPDAARRSIRWRNWIFGVGMICVVVSLGLGFLVFEAAGAAAALILEANPSTTPAKSGSHCFEFESTYGRFPDVVTIGILKKDFPDSTIPLGTSSSNDFFRQLLVSEICASERMFYSRPPGTASHRRPDNRFDGSFALEKGECGFAYIVGMTITSHPPETPIAVCPLVPGKLLFDYKFCKEYFDGKAVILRIDNSVTSLPVDKSGKVFLNGKDLFDPSQPFWGGKPPDVKWPE